MQIFFTRAFRLFVLCFSLFNFLFFSSLTLKAQTLMQGDISIVGWNSGSTVLPETTVNITDGTTNTDTANIVGLGPIAAYATSAFELGIPPTISVQPSNSIICASSNTSFSITAVGATSYQWQVNTGSGYTNIANGGVYSNATTATLNITGSTAGMNGYSYRCVVTFSAPPGATSNGATLTVNVAPSVSTAITAQSTCAGGNATFSGTFNNTTSYTWQVNAGAGFTTLADGALYAGQGTNTLSITGATVGMNGYTYRLVGSGTCTPLTVSGPAALVVTVPTITQNPFPATICEDDGTLFYIAASNATGYKWQVNTGSGYTDVSNGAGPTGGTYSGATGSVLIINNATVAMSGYTYRCVISGNCTSSATSSGALFTVFASVTYFEDFDNDGYGNGAVTTVSCVGAPVGFVSNFDDCDDNNNNIHPGAPEICGDGIDNNCDGNIDEVTGGVWLGTVNTNWSNTDNWSCGVLPTSTTDVFINASGNQPIVDIPTAICNNLTIGVGASLTIATSNALDIKGAVTNSGTFTRSGKVEFSGTAQAIPAGTYANLEIGGTDTKTLSGDVTVDGTLTLTSSFIQLDANNISISATGAITGGNSSSFIITNGSGAVKQAAIGAGARTGAVLFPVGVSTSSYTPVSLNNSTGASDEFSVRVIEGVNSAYDINDDPTGNAQTSFNVDRTWLVNEAVAGGSNVTLGFEWTALEEQGGFIRSSCFASHYSGGGWHRGPINQAASGSDPYTLSLANITSFSPFGVGSAGSTLPLTLISFSGKPIQDGIQLQWKTENESNLAYFDVQRSDDGATYTTIGKISAMNIPGAHNYSFTDVAASSKTLYYRLRQTDIDGKFTYSSVIVFSGDQNRDAVLLYPNPVINQTNLSIRLTRAAKTSFSLFDNNGKMIRKWQQDLQSGTTVVAINMEGLAAGLYHLELKGAKNSLHHVKLIKQ